MNIYVGNLPYKLKANTLRETFEEFGDVESADIIIDKRSGRSRGYGFVTMSDDSAAQDAITALNGSDLEGRTMKVAESRPREEGDRPRRSNHRNNNHRQQQSQPAPEQKSGGLVGFIKGIFGK